MCPRWTHHIVQSQCVSSRSLRTWYLLGTGRHAGEGGWARRTKAFCAPSTLLCPLNEGDAPRRSCSSRPDPRRSRAEPQPHPEDLQHGQNTNLCRRKAPRLWGYCHRPKEALSFNCQSLCVKKCTGRDCWELTRWLGMKVLAESLQQLKMGDSV